MNTDKNYRIVSNAKVTGEKITSIHIYGACFQNQFLKIQSEDIWELLSNTRENKKEKKKR